MDTESFDALSVTRADTDGPVDTERVVLVIEAERSAPLSTDRELAVAAAAVLEPRTLHSAHQ